MNTRSIGADYISAALGELDERIFAEAYLTDSAEKMKELIRKEKREKVRSAFCARNLKRVGALAACCAAAMAIVISVPYVVRFIRQSFDLEEIQVVPPYYDSETPSHTRITIDSIDKLNYYSAKKILGAELSSGTVASSEYVSAMQLSTGTAQSVAFGPSDVFTVSEVSFFEIDVEAESFIARMVGEGRVEVVVTKNNLADMITFKNGDRFYSCAASNESAELENERSFYSANSVSGFSIYRTDMSTGYRFDVIFENGCAVDLRCVELTTNAERRFEAVGESSVSSKGDVSFTVSSLEKYLNERKGDGTVEVSGDRTDSNCMHIYGEWSDAANIPCGEDGFVERVCSKCGDIDSRSMRGTHIYGSDGRCVHCGIPSPDELLHYELVNNSYYRVSIGESTSEVIAIAESYNGLPVREIVDFSRDIGSNSLRELYIPASVTKILNGAFYYCESLQTVHIAKESELEIIEGQAFYYCTELRSISLENCKKLDSIAECVFYYCRALESIHIPDGVTRLGNQVFTGCKSLSEVYYPSTVNSLGSHIFYECNSLKNIDFMSKASKIGDYMFYFCEGLEGELHIPDNIKEIGEGGFYGCRIKKAILHDGVETIHGSVFSYCSLLETVVFPKGTREIPMGMFQSCNSLKNVENISDVTEIGGNAFYACNSLVSIDLSKTKVTKIGENAFSSCRSLTDIKLPNTLEMLSGNVFGGCISLETVELPDSVSYLGYGAFMNCESLERIDISHVSVIDSIYTFENCKALREVILPEKIERIGAMMFRGCTSLKSIELPQSVNKIEKMAFYECSSLLDVTLGTGSTWSISAAEEDTVTTDITSSPSAFAKALVKTYYNSEWQRLS